MNELFSNALSAADSTVLKNLEATSQDLFSTISMYVYIAIAFALIGCGLLYVFGSEEGKMKANKWLPRVVIGAGIVICAVSGSQWITSLFTGA